MVQCQLRERGIADERVLDAMGRVPREEFVPHELAESAYADRALPIGGGQTISQPYVVAYTLEAAAIREGDRVLDIGTGSGYAAAVASLLAKSVFTIERDPSLAAAASERLRRLGFLTVRCAAGDGTGGWPAHLPYQAVVAAAAGIDVPSAWMRQVADGGRIVAPLGPPDAQNLVRLVRHGRMMERRKLLPVRYVPLVSEGGASGVVELP